MRSYEAAGIGIIMGCLYGLTLWAATDALSLASFILFKNTRLLPELTTGLVMIIGFFCLFTYKWWEPVMEKLIIHSVKRETEPEDDKE
jgi:predicted MFS family arabinose efflux permease